MNGFEFEMVLKAARPKVQLLASKQGSGLTRAAQGKVDGTIFLGGATGQLSFLRLIVHGLDVSAAAAADARQQHNHSFTWSAETSPLLWVGNIINGMGNSIQDDQHPDSARPVV